MNRVMWTVLRRRFGQDTPAWFEARVRRSFLDQSPVPPVPRSEYIRCGVLLVPMAVAGITNALPLVLWIPMPFIALTWFGFLVPRQLVAIRSLWRSGKPEYMVAVDAAQRGLTGHERMMYADHVRA